MRFPVGIRIPVPIPEIISTIFRVNPVTGETRGDLFLAYQQIATTLTQQRPREASPTGKSGMGVATYSQPPQPINLARKKTVLPAHPNAEAGRLITTGPVNPFDSIKGIPGPNLNVKYTG